MKILLKSVGHDYLLKSVSTLKGIGPKSSKRLSQASVKSVLDLLLILPRKYKYRDFWFKLEKSLLPRLVTLEVSIKRHIYPKSKRSPVKIEAENDGTLINIILFSFNTALLDNYYPIGQNIVISGELTFDGGNLTMIHPDYSLKPNQSFKIPKIEPIYPSISGLGNRVLQKVIGYEINNFDCITEW